MSVLFRLWRGVVEAGVSRRSRLSGLALVLVAFAGPALSASPAGAYLSKTPASVAEGSPFCEAGTGAGQCEEPLGVAVNQGGSGGVAAGAVYVVDSGNDRIEEFSASGVFVRAFGLNVGGVGVDVCETTCGAGAASAEAGGLSEPQGVTIEQSTGNLYVTDQGNHRVDVYSAVGVFEGAFGWKVNATTPEEKLQFCTTSTRCQAAATGGGAGEFGASTAPIGYPAIDSSTGLANSGDVYIGDKDNARVDEFHPTLTSGKVTAISFMRAFGWEVETTTSSFQICTTTCKAGTSSKEVGGFSLSSPSYLAVNASGTVYAVTASASCSTLATGECRVQDFEGDGTGTTATEQLKPAEFAATHLHVTSGKPGEVGAGPIAVELATGEVYVVKGISASEHRLFEFESSGTFLGEGAFGDSLPEATGLAVGIDEKVYMASGPTNKVYILIPQPAPVVTIGSATNVSSTSATLHGSVNPMGAATTHYFFEYSSNNGANWTKTTEETLSEKGHSAEDVSQVVNGLAPNTTYEVRLVANNGAEVPSSVETLTTEGVKPLIAETRPAGVGTTRATFEAELTPYNAKTTYHFEYGTTTAYGSSTPEVEPASISSPSLIAEKVTGLQPNTEYYFRLVATNATGTSEGSTATFTTLSNEPHGCPNEQARAESNVDPETGIPFSTQLPECRAYEMVSPLLKNGAEFINGLVVQLASGSSVARVGLEGNSVLVRSTGIWPSGEQPVNNNELDTDAHEGVQYRITRGESGWSFRPEVPADLRTFENALLPSPGDISANGVWTGAGVASSEGEIQLTTSPNLYLLEPDGALAEVGPSVPLSDQDFVGGNGFKESDGNVNVVAGSEDLSRVIFDILDFRWPFDHTKTSTSTEIPSLYEYVGTGHSGEGSGVPSLVGVDNTGTQIGQCGTNAGGYELVSGNVVRSAGAGEAEARSVSAGGSTVFFTALAADGSACAAGTGGGPSVNQLFARIGDPGAGAAAGEAVTVNVAASSSSGCASSDSCDVTGAVAYQGASTNGSKVFFTSPQPLVAGDTDATSNLYECVLPGDSGTPSASASKVNPCPSLVRVSVPLSGAGSEVLSVPAVSQDGSHVYYIAKGVLAGENAEHASPKAGGDNLYVWEAPTSAHQQGRTAFIATLSTASIPLGDAQATPDGDSLVFTSSADLTSDDTSTVAQVFLYNAQNEVLTRVSKGQDGFNDDGNTTVDPASIVSNGEVPSAELSSGAAEGRREISENGSEVVFQSSDTLTPQVDGGTNNVYLWRDGNVYLISDGTSAGERAGRDRAGLVGIDASGQNVFFTTEAQLVGQDTDELPDLYDARVDGGFPAPKVVECSGEACQGTPSAAPLLSSIGSVFPASGNTPVSPSKTVSKPVSKPKALTRAQKLARALKACNKDKKEKKRAKCEKAARKRYGAKTKSKAKVKAKRKTDKSAGKGSRS